MAEIEARERYNQQDQQDPFVLVHDLLLSARQRCVRGRPAAVENAPPGVWTKPGTVLLAGADNNSPFFRHAPGLP